MTKPITIIVQSADSMISVSGTVVSNTVGKLKESDLKLKEMLRLCLQVTTSGLGVGWILELEHSWSADRNLVWYGPKLQGFWTGKLMVQGWI